MLWVVLSVGLIALAVAAVVGVMFLLRGRRRTAKWARIAAKFGLKSEFSGTHCRMHAEDIELAIAIAEDSITFSLEVAGCPDQFSFGDDDVEGNPLEVGDETLDAFLRLWGEPSVVYALLDAANRVRVPTVAAAGGLLTNGTLRLSGGFNEALILRALDLGRSLQEGAPPVRLIQNTAKERNPEVRLRMLRVAMSAEPSPEAEELAKIAMAWDPACQVEAASYLDERKMLEDLADDNRWSQETRVRAMTSLLLLGDDGHQPLLIEALESENSRVRSMAVEALWTGGDSTAIPALKIRAKTAGSRHQREAARDAIDAIKSRA